MSQSQEERNFLFMKLRKIVTLGLLCTLGLVACKNDSTTPTTTPTQPSTVEPKPSTGDSTTTEKPADRDAVYNVLSKLKTTKAAMIIRNSFVLGSSLKNFLFITQFPLF